MIKQFSITGIIDNQGIFMSADTEGMNNFFSLNKNHLVIGKFEVFDQENPTALNSYYYKYIVPTFTQLLLTEGTISSDGETDVYLKEQVPIMYLDEFDTESGKFERKYRSFTDLNQWNKLIYISELKRIAIEIFQYVFVDK